MPNFSLTDKEALAADVWVAEHNKIQHGGKFPYAGATGGQISYEVTFTGIGVSLSIHCNNCREKGFKEVSRGSLTDFSNW